MTLRAERIGETIRSILAVELLQLTDPRLESVAVTGVDVTPDLAHASVYFDVLGGEEARLAAQRALDGATRRLQQSVARGLHARRTPKLAFAPDHGIAAGERLDATLRELRSSGMLDDAPDDDMPDDGPEDLADDADV
jgi:ribosome-binding factor A